MNTTRRPSLVNRTMSTPLSVQTTPTLTKSSNGRVPHPTNLRLDLMTPPSSPRHARSSSDLSTRTDDSSTEEITYFRRHRKGKSSVSSIGSYFGDQITNGTIICPYDVELLRDQRNREQIFGYGAWSTVFKGKCQHKPTSGSMTPPLSPIVRPPALVAVKQPARKDAKIILENEAKILTHLSRAPGNDQYIVPFYGTVTTTSAIVLAAIPLSLEEHIRNSARDAQARRTTWNMSEPVIGTSHLWLDLALQLVSALHWLHSEAMVIHGDIKPGNILLDRLTGADDMDVDEGQQYFPYQPLFADFSSSQQLGGKLTPNTLSAVTREYTAPELLTSKVLSNPESTATTASDVFSLAVTLLVAATGNTMVYSGSVYQRQAMATQGWMVLQAAKNGPLQEGARVPRQGVVERALDKAVLREGTGRTDAYAWKVKLEDMLKGEPSKI